MADETQEKPKKAPPEIKGATPEELALVQGNLAGLTPEQRVTYYRMTCESLGLNPLTRPMDYISLNGKLTLYAKKDATDQLRSSRRVSILIASRETVEGVYVVTARATLPDGRADESIGAVPLPKDPAERANAIMRAETKAKRRVTLSICGLGMLDETELDTMPKTAYVVGEPVLALPAAKPAWLAPKPPDPPLVDKEARMAELRGRCLDIFAKCSQDVRDRVVDIAAPCDGRSEDVWISDTVIELLKLFGMRASTLDIKAFEEAVLQIEVGD